MTTKDANDHTAPPSATHRHRHRHLFVRDAVAVAGVAVTVATSTAADGGAGWRLLRAAALLACTAGASELADRSSGRRVAAVAAPVGTIAIVVGVGIGIPHLMKVGPTLAAVAGAIALVTGLALVVTGGAIALGGARWWQQVAAIPSGVVVLAVTVGIAAPALLATNVAPTALGDETPAERDVEFESVTVGTADGVRLAGWYVPSRHGAAVVVRHGAGSTRSNVLDHIAVLADAGYGVLALDARGHGESDGRAMDFGWYGDLDIAAAVDFLAAQPGIDPEHIGVVGLSMGGEEALGAAASNARIHAVVAEGATARTDEDKQWLSEVYGARGWFQERLEWVQYTLTDALTDAERPTPLRDGVASGTPTFVIAAGAVADEVHVARVLHAAAPETVETWTVEGAGHTDGLDVARDEWTRRVVAFLDRALRGA